MTSPKAENPVRDLFAGLAPDEARSNLRFVWLSNFEAERFWASSSLAQLPKLSQAGDVAVVNRLEEMGLFLAEYPDVLILREPPAPEYLDYLTRLGFRLPDLLTASPPDKQSPISTAILANDGLCESLSDLSKQGDFYLLPYAKTKLEEQIISRTGLKSVGPSAEIFERVNSKIYSRQISSEVGLRTIDGETCESLEELARAFDRLSGHLTAGKRLVLKEAMGVSGKGLVLIDNPAKFQQLLTLFKRRAKPETTYSFVLEVWVDKLKDINYQIFINASGEVRLLNIKEIATQGGVHMGHRFPPELSEAQLDAYREATEAIGARLFKDGFTGIAGIDSIIDTEGAVYPVLEINARFNMSTYQLGLDRLIEPGSKVIARHYPLLLNKPLAFGKLAECIGPELFTRAGDPTGVLIQNFATVNVNADSGSGEPFKGRVYVLVIGRSFDEVARIDQRVQANLSAWQLTAS